MTRRNPFPTLSGILTLLVWLTGSILAAENTDAQTGSPQEKALRSLQWRSIGPANMGGRVTDIAGVPGDPTTFYVAGADGGLFKTTNAGVTFEALFQNKPVLMFGHRFYQYAPGVYRIQNSNDCKKALHEIINEHAKPSSRDMRLFIKAIEDCTETSIGGGLQNPHETRSKEERAKVMGEYISKKLKPFFDK